MADFNFNLRGLCISPDAKTSIKYYLCLMDIPSGAATTGNFAINPDPNDPNVIRFYYSGNLADLDGTAAETINMPMWTYKPFNMPTSILITDNYGNTVQGTGDPNKGKPPVIRMNANPDTNFYPTNYIIPSESFVNSNQDYSKYIYNFVVVMASSVPSGGYLNSFGNINPVSSVEGVCISCALQPEDGYKNVAVIGVYATSYNGVQWTAVNYPGAPSLSIEWNNPLVTFPL